MALLKVVPLSEAGSALKEIRREAKGFTSQEELSKLLKKSLPVIIKIENDGNFSKELLIDYCKAIGLGEPFIIFAVDEEDVKRLLKITQ